MNMKKLLALILAACMGLAVVTGCSSGNNSSGAGNNSNGDAKTSVDAIKEAGVIVMYTNAAFPPFEYMSNNEVVGVDVDIAKEIAADLGVELEIGNVEFDSILAGVQSGKASFGIAGMTVKPEREEMVDFSISYAKSTQYLIVKEGESLQTASDLAGLKIGVQEGTTGDFVSTDDIEGAEVSRYKTALEAAMDLQAGRVDVVMIDQLPAENIVSTSDGLKTVEFLYDDGSNTAEEYAVCVKKGDKELLDAINKTLERLISEGKIDEYITEHTINAKI